ncbi:uncharacterized protein LOC116176254 [Photinus pyralis]|nr:uncharacterized protein LOC116176254 [Photinus pyralis]
MGDDRIEEKTLSKPIQPVIAERWTNILTNGLTEEVKKALIDKHLPPENLQALLAPKLNPEIKAAIPEGALRRDARLQLWQKQIGAATSAVASGLSSMLKEGADVNKGFIETLSDVGRLLSDLHFCESFSRRELLSLQLNKDLKDTLKNTNITDFIFGENLDTNIKSAKDLEKSAEQLKLQKKVFRPAASGKPENSRRPFMQRRGVHQNGRGSRAPRLQRRQGHLPVVQYRKEHFHSQGERKPRQKR